MTPHNEANIGDIAKTVLMSGDPLRVKYIAENFLEDFKLVNSVRGMYCYKGKYKDKEISVMAHGMGIPSMGIYSYELFHIYGVDTIIRLGSCGALSDKLELFDIVLVENAYTESNYALSFDNKPCNLVQADREINNIIEETAKQKGILCKKGNVLCSDCFDPYLPDKDAIVNRAPKDLDLIASEMESFALFYNAKRENKKAVCILTVSDVPKSKESISAEERQNSMDNMIKLALDTAINLK